jgi:hypothetical protein
MSIARIGRYPRPAAGATELFWIHFGGRAVTTFLLESRAGSEKGDNFFTVDPASKLAIEKRLYVIETPYKLSGGLGLDGTTRPHPAQNSPNHLRIKVPHGLLPDAHGAIGRSVVARPAQMTRSIRALFRHDCTISKKIMQSKDLRCDFITNGFHPPIAAFPELQHR